jgi:hypothetical protein
VSPRLRGRFFIFPVPRDYGDLAPLCGLLPAFPSRRPTPHSTLLLKTKTQPQFDRTVTERSKFIFRVFQPSNQAQCQPVFFVFTVRSAEGRNRLQQTCWQHQPLANGGLLIASCSRLSKIAAQGTLEPKSEYYTLPIVRPRCQ